MNLVDGSFLGNYNHDFPRLAKQSGFFFQLHRGKVNWSEIESLNLDDVTENRNFQLLERNLLNVINFNPERDVKISDRNFAKLFKVAQLGIDYLSYCELYLDRCVVLLQEQLMSVQEELESLKNQNEGKNSEQKKTKNIKKHNSYQCEKCEKVFISDVYLKYHEKRRHSNLSTPESKESLQKKLVNASQQTENKETFSVSIQTVLYESDKEPQKNEEMCKVKKNQNKKIKRLEKNLRDVKARLQKAEKCLQETREANSLIPLGFPNPAHFHPLLQFVSPCFPPTRNLGDAGEGQKSPVSHKDRESPESDEAELKERKISGGDKNYEPVKIDLICDKENVNPQNSNDVIKPLPPPRKAKKKIKTEENVTVNSARKIVPLSNVSLVKEIYPENAEENLKEKNSNESLNVSKEKSEDLKKVVEFPSKLHKLSKNLRKPLTNFYDSVSSKGKNLMKSKKAEDAKGVLVDDLNNQLRELGIDPEWKGIPKKTMKQKLKHLTNRRRLLFKADPLYRSVRQSAEKKIIEKLKRNFFLRKTLPQKSFPQETEEEFHPTDEESRFQTQEIEIVRDKKWEVLLDADVDSWSKESVVDENQLFSLPCGASKQHKLSEGEDSPQMGGKISDSGIKTEKEERRKKDVALNETNSDFEEDFSIPSGDWFFKTARVESEKLPVENSETLIPLTR